MKPLDLGLSLFVMLIWGVNFVASKWGVMEIPPLFYLAIRFAIVGALLAPIFRVTDLKSHIPFLFLFGLLLGVGHFGLTFVGLRGADASTAAILIQLQVPMSTLLAFVFFNDRLGWRRGIGIAIAFSGVVLLAGEPHAAQWWAVLLIVVSAFNWALSNVVLKKSKPIDSLALNGWMAVFAAPQLLILSLLIEDGHMEAVTSASMRAWGSLAYTVLLSSILGYTMWYKMIGRYSMNQIVPLTLISPVIGVISGILLMDDPITWERVVGAALTLGGVALIQFWEIQRARNARLSAKAREA